MVLFGESVDAVRLGCIVLIVAGLAGLKLAPPQRPGPTRPTRQMGPMV
jgi:hypothetical protein